MISLWSRKTLLSKLGDSRGTVCRKGRLAKLHKGIHKIPWKYNRPRILFLGEIQKIILFFRRFIIFLNHINPFLDTKVSREKERSNIVEYRVVFFFPVRILIVIFYCQTTVQPHRLHSNKKDYSCKYNAPSSSIT